MSAQSTAVARGARPAIPAGGAASRFVVLWALVWALAGALVGVGIAFSHGSIDVAPVLRLSTLFAEVVGFTALVSARVVFPLFSRLPGLARTALQILTLFSGTIFGSAAILAAQPLFALARPRTVAMVVLVNAVLAVIVGIALHTYEAMRRQIEASYLALREKEAFERELAIAREVQHELLPRAAPSVAGLELAGVCLPAVGVGGDLFDFIPVSGERVAIVVGDVSGKGIPAALLMAGLQASVRSLAPFTAPPGEVTARLNAMLASGNRSSRYATLFFGLYDAATRSLAYSNAGHLPPVHLGGNGATRLRSGGVPIGMFEGMRYGEGRCHMAPGDLLVLFTDGIVETPGPDGEEFGEERLVTLLARHRRAPLAELIRIVLDERTRWSAEAAPHDDVTLVLARAR